jgi:hypothetical protein
MMISLVAFILLYLQTARLLFWGYSGIAAGVFSTPFNYLFGGTLNFREIQSLGASSFLGDPVRFVGVMIRGGCCATSASVLVSLSMIDATPQRLETSRLSASRSVGGLSVTALLTADWAKLVIQALGGASGAR